MSLISTDYFTNETACFKGLITNFGSVQSAYVNIANSTVYSNNITRVSSNSIRVNSTGLFMIKAPIYFDGPSGYTVYFDLETNGTTQNIDSNATDNYSFYYLNFVKNFNMNDVIKFKTRCNAVISNHTNGLCLSSYLSDAYFTITKIS